MNPTAISGNIPWWGWGQHADPQHPCGHNLTCNVMVAAPGWHFEFVPAARPQGSVTLLPAGTQGNSTAWQWTQGKRKRDKKGHTRHPVSEGMLSCYPTELFEEVSLCPQHNRDFLHCHSMSQHTMPRHSDMVVSIYGRGEIKDLDIWLQITGSVWGFFFCLCLFVLLCFSCGIFLVLFTFLNLGNDGWNKKRGEREKWK